MHHLPDSLWHLRPGNFTEREISRSRKIHCSSTRPSQTHAKAVASYEVFSLSLRTPGASWSGIGLLSGCAGDGSFRDLRSWHDHRLKLAVDDLEARHPVHPGVVERLGWIGSPGSRSRANARWCGGESHCPYLHRSCATAVIRCCKARPACLASAARSTLRRSLRALAA